MSARSHSSHPANRGRLERVDDRSWFSGISRISFLPAAVVLCNRPAAVSCSEANRWSGRRVPCVDGWWRKGDPMHLTTDSVFILTGGSGAIAGAVAHVLHSAGARLALVARDREVVGQRASQLQSLPLVADLSDFHDAVRVVSETVEHYGRVDGLIHTVGGFAMAPAAETSPELFERMLGLNVGTLFNAARAILPHFLEQDRGFIAGFSAAPVWNRNGAGMTAYVAAKGAVAAYLRALDDELAGTGVTTAVVYPMAAVDTPRNRREMPDTDPSGWVDPRAIGEALLFAALRGPRGHLLELPISP